MTTIDVVDDEAVDTRLLEQFVAVAEERNVTRAAMRIHAAQSTVSAGISSLERELGTTLFDRSARPLTLTVTGETLLAEARTALQAVDRMRDVAAATDATLRGRVRFGIFTNMDVIDLAAVISAFHARHPLVDVQLSSSPTGSLGLVQDLRAGRLDLAFSGAAVAPSGLRLAPLGVFPFRAFVAPGSRFADRTTISLAELCDEPFVETARGFANRSILDAALEERGLRRRIVAELNDMPAVTRFAATGIGVAVVPDFAHDGAVAIELEDVVEPLRISLASRAGTVPNRATRTLAEDVVRAARG